MKKDRNDTKPVMVIGGGIAGIFASLNLAEMDQKVILVEKSPALGGMLPYLFRTYPDCACCRIYGKMLEAFAHPNITTLTLSEVSHIERNREGFQVRVKEEPRYVDVNKCIACGKCRDVCPRVVDIPRGFQWGERKAVFMPYPQAVPYSYTIDAQECLYFKDGSCRECNQICPTEAIDFNQISNEQEFDVNSIILSAGFESTPASICYEYGYQLPNVLTAIEFERLMSISGPTQGKLLRPSDNTPPRKIAWIQCVGSRDTRHPECSHCSSVCCMHAIKEAISAKEILGDKLETDIYFMDIRAFGKNFEEYYATAKQGNVKFKHTRVHEVLPDANSDRVLINYHSEETDLIETDQYDMVILSTGMKIPLTMKEFANKLNISTTLSSFIETKSFSPVSTSVPGIYVCGPLAGPKDIYDSMVEAGAAAETSISRISLHNSLEARSKIPVSASDPRIGVFLCKCPLMENKIDRLKELTKKIEEFPHVSFVKDDAVPCTGEGRGIIIDCIKKENLDNIIVTGCSVTVYSSVLEGLLLKENLPEVMLRMVDLTEIKRITENNDKFYDGPDLLNLIENEIIRISELSIIKDRKAPVTHSALVVGGGISGMEFALSTAAKGFQTYLVEKTDHLGGTAINIPETWKGEPVQPYVMKLIDRIMNHSKISVFLNTEVVRNEGFVGNFKSVLSSPDGKSILHHGVTHLAPGAREIEPIEYLYGRNPGVLTLTQLEKRLINPRNEFSKTGTVVFIQCVGSREKERPYCSRTCCTRAILCALKLKKLNPRMNVCILYRDVRTYGLREELYRNALASGILFIKYDVSDKPLVNETNGKLEITINDQIIAKRLSIHPEILVLSAAIAPDLKQLSEVFSVDLDENGFFDESQQKMKPTQFNRKGITMSGMAHGPKFLEESIAQAKAAATHAISILQKDSVKIDGPVAYVKKGNCAACGTCVRVCPFGVPEIEHGVSVINEYLCQGCGACVAECPGKAISLIGYEDDRIVKECNVCFS